ncbi:hypothetical protein ACLOJK_026783 [Asimina triloba]
MAVLTALNGVDTLIITFIGFFTKLTFSTKPLAPKLPSAAFALFEVEAGADTILYLLALSLVELIVLAIGCLEVSQLYHLSVT